MPRRSGTDDLRLRLARGLLRERNQKGWTQEEAAEASQVHTRHYQKLESGEVNVTLGTVQRLCRAFGVDVVKLFET
ncbi:MAG: helix-turn-helix transcriptional regulator [Thermoanaerobaculia bacterium]|nr:helix-turn-helix transcriptional regulator [Thermoanaerobaculia bacterium]